MTRNHLNKKQNSGKFFSLSWSRVMVDSEPGQGTLGVKQEYVLQGTTDQFMDSTMHIHSLIHTQGIKHSQSTY